MKNLSHPEIPLRRTRAESREETRARLVDSAIELYARHGVTAVSLQLVAEHAGYSRGAFHSNFSGKDELLDAVSSAVIASLAPQLGAILTSSADSLARLEGYIRCYVQFCAERPERAQALIAIVREQSQQQSGSYEARAGESLAGIVELFAAGQRAGQMRAFDPGMMALTLRSALDAHSMEFSRSATHSGTAQPGWEQLADEIANTFIQATRRTSND
ncbi:TetR/AcrR family transcriptional regulator [Specibacter sp. AOP5-B1-6]|uniref:TetR/AcrR family transcriptional regulator n=1 Tax=Specibacter sp. AOP5-B1-6 TaxID=3457653 RepID=UPI00402B7848